MKIHNTLTRQLDTVTPLTDDTVRIYSCGPTVYDHIHIGNLSSFIYADTLRRAVEAGEHRVKHVMNFTDVDDKTIRRSREKYADLEPREALKRLTTEYGDLFLEDMMAVGNDTDAIEFIKATDSAVIKGMKQLVTDLHQAGFAYIADDGVYFSIEAYKKSGKTYGQLTEVSTSSTSEARIQNDEYDKESAHDFALWKKQKPGEPAWDFTLDGHELNGRPGWHLECSVMSNQTLGQPFDIHTGGVDLIFPHHENEIAQSTAGQKNPVYASAFVHNEHLLVDGKKMSKSLNNFYTLKDITDKGFDPLAFRMLVLQSHYRNQAHFSWENLESAQNRLRDLRALAALRWQALPVTHDGATFALEEVPLNLTSLLNDDLRSPQALAFLSDVSTQLQVVLIETDEIRHFEAMLRTIDELLGLRLQSVQDITLEQKQLIADREKARTAKDWNKSDKLRDTLITQGIGLRDTNYGTIWFPL
ncbi:MAG: cysS [Candidatus Saccharibacteria bacterium]|nr:cysS [Candidatus Saccharibacteria bacterium]